MVGISISGGRASRFVAQRDPVVNVRQKDLAVQTLEAAYRVQPNGFRQQPVPVLLTQKLLDAWLARRDQHVLPKGVQLPVLRELESTVMRFGGFREHFDDEGGLRTVSRWSSANFASPQTTMTSG